MGVICVNHHRGSSASWVDIVPDGREGSIEVSLSSSSGVDMTLEVRDDGIGFSSGTIENSKSFGLTLIYGLASDLSGEVRIDSHQGTRVKIWFLGANSFGEKE